MAEHWLITAAKLPIRGLDERIPAPDVIAVALTAVFEDLATRLLAGAGKRGKNRPAELADYSPAVLRGTAGLLRHYAGELANGRVPGVVPDMADATERTNEFAERVVTPIDDGAPDADPMEAEPGPGQWDDAPTAGALVRQDPWLTPDDVYEAEQAWDASSDPESAPGDPWLLPDAVSEPAPAAVVPGAMLGPVIPGSYGPIVVSSPKAESDAASLDSVGTFVTVGDRVGYRSVSQIESFSRCGMRYRLERVDKIPQLPAWWSIGGTATHAAIREWELDGSADPDEAALRWRHHWAETLAQTVLDNPDVKLDHYRAAQGGRENREWWLDHGPEMVATYVAAQAGREYVIERIGDGVGLELGFKITVGTADEGVQVHGFIDQLLRWSNGDVTVRDLKFGQTPDPGGLQLPAYRVAAELAFGIEASAWYGDYWVGRKAAPTRAVPLTFQSAYDRLAFEATEMDRAERAGIYLPNPSRMCSACGVRRACPVMGDEASRAPWRLANMPLTVNDATPSVVSESANGYQGVSMSDETTRVSDDDAVDPVLADDADSSEDASADETDEASASDAPTE